MSLSVTQIREMRAARAKKVNDANAIVEKVAAEKRDMSPEENEQFAKLHVDIDKEHDVILREERQLAANRSIEGGGNVLDPVDVARRSGGDKPLTDDERKAEVEARNKAVSQYLRRGEIDRRAMTISDLRDGNGESRMMTVGNDTAAGLLIPPDTSMMGKITDALKEFGFPEEDCTVLNTASGAELPIPVDNDTFNVAQAVAEGQCLGDAPDINVGLINLRAYKWGTGVVKASNELLTDVNFDIAAWIGQKLGERAGRIKSYLETVGSGNGQPQGIVTGSTLGAVAASQTAVAFNELLNLIHSVDPAYRPGSEFMFHDSTLLALKKMTDSQGRPLFLPGYALKEPDTINGVEYVINQHMAAMTAGAKSIIYGNFKNFYIRNVQGFAVRRLNEKYADCDMVGFVGFYRFDSVVVDAGTHPIKYLQQAA